MQYHRDLSVIVPTDNTPASELNVKELFDGYVFIKTFHELLSYLPCLGNQEGHKVKQKHISCHSLYVFPLGMSNSRYQCILFISFPLAWDQSYFHVKWTLA